MTRSVLDDLGEEITGIVAPVSICMALVVVLVKALNPDGNADSSSVAIATIAYHEKDSDSAGQKLEGALLNAIIFMAVIGGMTFLLFLLFKWGCYKVIYSYMGFAMFNVFFFLTGALVLQLLRLSGIHMDLLSFCFLLFNFSVVGILSLFFLPVPLFLKQAYTVWVGICVAYIFTHVPEWTSWVLLVIMALYDLAAVLLPGGPLKILVELAIERQQELPALIYEARPTSGPYQRGMWRNSQQEQQQQQQQQSGAERAPLASGNAPVASAAAGGGGVGAGLRVRSVVAPLAAVLESVAGRLRDGGRGGSKGGGSPSHRVALLAGHQDYTSDAQEMALTPRGSSRGGGQGPVWEAREVAGDSSSQADADTAAAAAAAARAAAAGQLPGVSGLAGQASAAEQPPIAAPAAGSAAAVALGAGSSSAAAAAGVVGAAGSSGAEQHQHQGLARAAHERDEAAYYEESEGSSLGLPDAIKLGLGDFIFYSMLVGRAAMYDLMTVFASYLAVIAGLVSTLLLLALARKALPALPISIALGVLFYFLTRLVMEPVIVPLSLNLNYY